ncbi:MAG TPA: cytidylate kinase-like family protein [Kofleriaceae bacterium]|nr:cytidylate kinase-like family protein [Kofleriaceae bacterium]
MLPRSIDRIVADQIERWRIERQRAERQARPPAPIVAVSREYGARGAAVAHLVAAQLGFSYWNRELIDEIARSKHVSAAMIETLDEHHDPSLLATLRGMDRGKLRATDYFEALTKVVHAIVSHGGAVTVGRGIALMLPPERALRVRVVCPLEQKVAGLIERKGLTDAAARDELRATDADRNAFIRDHVGADAGVPSAYDLHVNTGTFGVEGAAALVVAAYRTRFPA